MLKRYRETALEQSLSMNSPTSFEFNAMHSLVCKDVKTNIVNTRKAEMFLPNMSKDAQLAVRRDPSFVDQINTLVLISKEKGKFNSHRLRGNKNAPRCDGEEAMYLPFRMHSRGSEQPGPIRIRKISPLHLPKPIQR